MATLGEVQLRLSKLPCGAGVDKIVLLGVVNDVYQRYLLAYQWQRLMKTATLQTTAIYQDGTVAVTEGGTTLTGTGTTWTSAMTGRRIRIGGHNATYVFTFVSTTSATIDRPYEDETETVGHYYIFQSVYALASDVDLLESIAVPGNNADLDQVSPEYLDRLSTDRWTLGHPALYTLAPDLTVAGVSVPAVELYPVPDTSEGLIYRYRRSVANLALTSDVFLPWVQIEAIIAGCEAELYALKGDPGMFQSYEAKFNILLHEARLQDSDRQYPDGMWMDDRYTWHRRARALGHDTMNRHWWQLHNSD